MVKTSTRLLVLDLRLARTRPGAYGERSAHTILLIETDRLLYYSVQTDYKGYKAHSFDLAVHLALQEIGLC